MHQVTQRVEALADFFSAQAAEADALGRLPDATAAKMREAGAIRMLQPKAYSGYEAHPAEWLETLISIGSRCASSGWVAGVVGVHPWNVALTDPKLQEEIWGADPDTWIASPYSPMGTATVSDDGYILKGRWSFSSGTDHCDWAVLGAFVVDQTGRPTTSPPTWLHLFLPKSDYAIVPDSWNVLGLNGTGSKDVIVDNAYIPGYRTIQTFLPPDKPSNFHALEAGLSQPLYNIPFASMFSLAITGGILGAAEGVLAQFIAYQTTRVGPMGVKFAEDPQVRYVLAEASADIEASRDQVSTDMSRLFDFAAKGNEVPVDLRAKVRSNQVRAAHRAAEAATQLFTIAGGNATRIDNPILRFWRAVHTGLHHTLLVTSGPYQAAGAVTLKSQPPPGTMF